MTDNLTELNVKLAEISQRLYGEKLYLKVVDPRELLPMRKNARYMPKEMFDQLTRNISQDGAMHSVPLCHTLDNGKLEILSGNHRVQAAIKAKLQTIVALVIPTELKPGQKRAVQISHNALAGRDDMQLLSELWNEIEDINEKIYAGLDSDVIGELQKIKFSGFGPAQIRTEQVTVWFLPDELEKFEQVIEAMTTLALSKTVYMAPLEKYEKLHKLLVQKKKSANIKNTSVAFMALIDELIEHEREKNRTKRETADADAKAG